MATFETKPKILLSVEVASHLAYELDEYIYGMRLDRSADDGNYKSWTERAGNGRTVDHLLLDVDVAEKAVAWLKAHGVERAP